MSGTNCVGKNLAILELRATGALVAQRRIRFTANGGPGLQQRKDGIEDYFTTSGPALFAHLEAR